MIRIVTFLFVLFPLINAVNFNIINKCNYQLNLFTNENSNFNKLCDLNNNEECQKTYNNIQSGLIKHTLEADATLFEFTINELGMWYDISVIPPGSGVCNSYDECRQKSSSDSYNVPIDVIPQNIDPLYIHSCIPVKCHNNQCKDAYLYPYDDLKTHYCSLNTNFDLIYCNDQILNDTSSNMNDTGSDMNDINSNWNDTSSNWNDTSSDMNDTSSDMNDTSSNWNDINSDMNNTSSNMNNTSSNWNDTSSNMNDTSSNWNDINSDMNDYDNGMNNNYLVDNNLNDNYNIIFNGNSESQLVSVCKDATYLIKGPICAGSGILPSGYKCPLKGTETNYECSKSSVNYKNGICIAKEHAECLRAKSGVWKCIYPSIGCNEDITENKTVESTENETVESTENETVESTENETVESTDNSNVNETVESTENETVESTENETVESTDNSNINETVESTDNSNINDTVNNNLYTLLDFNWTDLNNWEYSSGNTVPADMFLNNNILLSSENSKEPIRTKMSWAGEKIILFEWERSETSDTNIWMLNEKLRNQFEKDNGWPHWGELDIFEMFTEDKFLQPQYDFTGFKEFTDVSSYGQLTLHMGAKHNEGDPCFCPSSPSKDLWYQDQKYMTSSCTGQIPNINNNKVAMVFGTDENGQYLQLIQFPIIEEIDNEYSILSDSNSNVLSKIYNNKELFWGVPLTQDCVTKGGHNPNTGFPFFENFYIVLEEQRKENDAWFKINKIEIYIKK